MRSLRTLGVAGLVAVALICGGVGSAVAAEAVIGADVVSAYVWRGITFNEDMVVQPYLDVTAENGFNVNVWANYDADDYNGTLEDNEFSEVDLTLSYGASLGPVDLSVGHIEYLFPNGGKGTGEVFLGASVSPIEGLSIGLDAYFDYDELDEYYVSGGVSYDIALPMDIGLSLGASAGHAGDKYAANDDAGLYDYNLSVSVAVPVTEAIEVAGFIAYTDTFDKDTLPEQDVDTYGGVGVSFGF